MIYSLTVRDCVKQLNLDVICGEEFLDREVSRATLSRPGVEIYAGYFDFYEFPRIQLIGSKEINLFYMLDENVRQERVNKLFEPKPPAFVFTKNVETIPQMFIEAGKKYGVAVLRSHERTTVTFSALGYYLSEALAEKKALHGTMMDINGVGVLITGKSRVGKSETALELLTRGHTLVCDDSVEVGEAYAGLLVASCPKTIERMLEVRGIGIVDVVELFGVKAFRNKKKLMLIVELVKWSDNLKIDRLGLEEKYEQIFDTKVPKCVIYVMPGRNIATQVEVAAMNWRLKSFGKNTSLEFINKIDNIVKGNGGKN